jgi:hypothetical protein
MPTLALLQLLACTQPADKTISPDDTALTDTAAEDTGTEDTAQDSGDTGDDSGEDTGPRLTWVLDRAVTGAALALHPLDPRTGLEEIQPAWTSVGVSGDHASLPVTEPPASTFVPVDGEEGLELAMFAPLLWDDSDGDLAHDSGERFRASTRTVAVYFRGTLSPEMASLGIVLGWNALTLSTDGALPVPVRPDAIPLPLNLDPRETITFGGGVDGEADGWSLLVANPVDLSDGALDEPIHRSALTSRWSVTLEGAPPASHLVPLSDATDLLTAIELPLAWIDLDDTPGLSGGDGLMRACLLSETGEVRGVNFLWIDAVRDPSYALMFGFYDYNAGWMAAYEGGETVRVTDEDRASLYFSSACGGF